MLTTILLLNLFWAVFLLPGFAAYTLLASRLPEPPAERHFARTAVFSFFLSNLLLMPVVVLAFFMTVGFPVIAAYFCLLVAASAVYLLAARRELLALGSLKSSFLTDVRWRAGLLVLIAADFVLANLARGFVAIGGDVWTHLASANHTVNHGLSIFDPYFLDKGRPVIDSIHPANMVHLLVALPSGLLHLSVLDVWAYSTPFFRIIAFATVYVFVRQLTKNRHVALFATLLFYLTQLKGEALLTILYPANQALFTTIFLLMITLPLLNRPISKSRTLYLLYMAAIVLLSFTHQIQWSLAALLLGSYYLLLFVTREMGFKKLVALGTPLALGLPTALFSLVEAKYVPAGSRNIGVDQLQYFSSKLYALAFNNPSLATLALLTIVGLLLAPRYIKSARERALVAYAVLFGIVLLYTPLFTIVSQLLPLWGIQRYDYLSNLALVVFAALPLWFIYESVKRRDDSLFPLVALLTLLFIVAQPYQKDFSNFWAWGKRNAQDYATARQFVLLDKPIKPGSVVMADRWAGFFEPALCDCYVVGIDNTRTTDSINTLSRYQDAQSFFSPDLNASARRQLIKKYNASYVVAPDNEGYVNSGSLGLKKIAGRDNYSLYAVN